MIISFKEYQQQFTETFNSQPYLLKWEWRVQPKDFRNIDKILDIQLIARADAETDQKLYLTVEFLRRTNVYDKDGGSVDISFDINGYYEPTGNGDQWKIFSTVLEASKTFIEKVHPSRLTFSASKLETNADHGSRFRLYNTMVKKFANSAGYSFSIDTNNPLNNMFILTRIA